MQSCVYCITMVQLFFRKFDLETKFDNLLDHKYSYKFKLQSLRNFKLYFAAYKNKF